MCITRSHVPRMAAVPPMRRFLLLLFGLALAINALPVLGKDEKAGPPKPAMRECLAFYEDVRDAESMDWIDSQLEQARWQKKSAEGYVAVRSEGRLHQGTNQYRKLYKKRLPGMEVWSRSGETESGFNDYVTSLAGKGYVLVWAQSFVDKDGIARFQAIWVQVTTEALAAAGAGY